MTSTVLLWLTPGIINQQSAFPILSTGKGNSSPG